MHKLSVKQNIKLFFWHGTVRVTVTSEERIACHMVDNAPINAHLIKVSIRENLGNMI